MAGRPKGSKNATTKLAEKIKDEMRTTKRKKRVVPPKGIIPLTAQYRILIDPMCYTLERKLGKDEIKEDEIVSIEEDEEVVLVDATKDEDKWTKEGYFSLSTVGLSHLIDNAVHDSTARKYSGKKVQLDAYLQTFKTEYSGMKSLIVGAMK